MCGCVSLRSCFDLALAHLPVAAERPFYFGQIKIGEEPALVQSARCQLTLPGSTHANGRTG